MEGAKRKSHWKFDYVLPVHHFSCQCSCTLGEALSSFSLVEIHIYDFFMGEEWIQNADELSFCWIMLSALFQSGASCCVSPASDVNKNLKPHLTDVTSAGP